MSKEKRKIIIDHFADRLRCLVGFHKIDEDEGWDHYDLNEDYIKTIFYCEKCNKRIIKQL